MIRMSSSRILDQRFFMLDQHVFRLDEHFFLLDFYLVQLLIFTCITSIIVIFTISLKKNSSLSGKSLEPLSLVVANEASCSGTKIDSDEASCSGSKVDSDEASCKVRNEIPCRFKGVVLHKNGNYGAQIYADHQRVWLGTFRSELDAALAYDRAAITLRSDDPYRNIYASRDNASLEIDFQRHYTTEDVLNMIKRGSYDAHLTEFKRTFYNLNRNEKLDRPVATKLFEKELTPSDVGKLNRLVIPKKSALKLQELLTGCGRGGVDNGRGGVEDVDINFFDRHMKCWKLRFVYWKSSQSYVFTKGWSTFVKGNKLMWGDLAGFHYSLRRENLKAAPTPFFSIDYRKRMTIATDTNIECRPRVMGLLTDKVVDNDKEKNSFRLFGVNIVVD